jgi:hypothetical protein
MDSRTRKLLQDGELLWSRRLSLSQLWQEIAYQFYVEMADFTVDRYLGDEFGDHLSTSFPLIARRSLGDSVSAMLRPVNLDSMSPGVWFSIKTEDEAHEKDIEARRWLEYATGVQRRAMYDRRTNFVRATKEGDQSFVTFGQCPLTLELNRNRDALLYRCWHLKDVAWTEGAEGDIHTVYRKWKPTARQLYDTFGDKVSSQVKQMLDKEPHKEVNCKHIVIPTDAYEQRDAGGSKFRQPYVSIWVDCDFEHIMEEVGSWSQIYIIPRWVTIPGSQYAASPAVTAALPDARLIQAMTLTILDSGEKFADPPMLATQEAIRSDVQLFPGGITYVDAEYDERLGEALRPLYESRAGEGLRTAFEMRAEVAQSINKAFFLDSLSLPPAEVREMTAFEVGQRISEWIRRAMPIFEPLQWEYNGRLCEETFELLMRNGAFGPVEDMPQSLRGASVKFRFESPLHEGSDRKKAQKFLEAKSVLVNAAELDPGSVQAMNIRTALIDSLRSMAPATWVRSEREMEQIARQEAEAQAAQQQMQGGMAGAEMAQKLGSAAKDFSEVGGGQSPF